MGTLLASRDGCLRAHGGTILASHPLSNVMA
jgi:hypothetical protein